MSATTSSSRPQGWMGQIAAILVGAVLVFSAVTKVLGPKAFVAAMEGYELFPASQLLLLATGVTALEFMLGILLLTGVYRRFAAWLGLPLIVAFMGLLVFGMRKGLESCGCFGEVVAIPPAVEIGIDAVLLVLLVGVLAKGSDVRRGPTGLRHALAWGSLCAGAVLFLSGSPVTTGGGEELDVELTQLQVLEQRAEPSLPLADEALLFFFSADCDHCWSFASAVENTHLRIPELSVAGVTFSDPQALEEFVRGFAPTYPIHTVPESVFDSITSEYPAAIWITQGNIEKTWMGFVPSHRELADSGGYVLVEGPLKDGGPAPEEESPETSQSGSLFGGPASSRH